MEPGSAWRDWIGRYETAHDVVNPTPYAALSATLDRAAGAAAARHAVAAAVALAVFPAAASSIDARARRARRARRLPAARAAAAPDVGRQPARRSTTPLRVGDALTRVSTIEERHREAAAAAARWCSCACATRSASTGDAASALTEHHDIVYREAPQPGDVEPRRAGARARDVVPHVGARRRAAVPLLGADVQRPSHPLRPALRDRGRRLSRDSSCTGR